MSSPKNLMDLACHLVDIGRAAGADEIEVTVDEGLEFNVDVRLGRVEKLLEAGSKAVSVRLIKGNRTAFSGSSDLNPGTLKKLIQNAVKRADLGSVDEFSGLPELMPTSIRPDDLAIFDPKILEMDSGRKIALALETERIALEDKRISNSHGANFETRWIKSYLANSKGFSESFEETFCSLSLGLQAGDTDSRVEDFWFSSGVLLDDLDPPERIAGEALRRTLRQLNPRKVPTCSVPVILEPLMSSWLLDFIFVCVSGKSIYREASFLTGRLGETVGNPLVNIHDDGLLPGKLGSRPYDSEGVPSRRTIVFEKGVLKNYLCDTYAARKLGLRSTGNADGSGVGPNNFIWQPGSPSPESIIAGTDRGLLLTRTLGHGLNPVTGDISTGAFGLWIEGGQIAFPVAEITVSGNLGDILKNILAVGRDLDFRTALVGPTLKIAEMTIAGV